MFYTINTLEEPKDIGNRRQASVELVGLIQGEFEVRNLSLQE